MEKKKVTGQELRQMARREIIALEAVKSKLDEAKAQLRDYQQSLQQKYGDTLKLRTYAVVGIGVERLVWAEVTNTS